MCAHPISTAKDEAHNKAAVCALLIIILTQLAVMAFWMTQRVNYFNDELFSFGYAQSYTFASKDVVYFYKTSDWKYETWIENQSLKKHLEVSAEESLLNQQPERALKLLLHRRNYFGILNILMSIFALDGISKYPAVIFNIILLLITQLLIYRITEKITGSRLTAVLAVLMYGFSTMAVDITMYIRFYSWVLTLLLAVIRIHQIIWRTEKIWVEELLIAAAMALLYFAMRNSELAFIIGGALIGSFILASLWDKQYRKTFWYLITTVPVGLYYVIKKTDYLNIILHPEHYTEKSWPINTMTNSVLSMAPATLLKNTKKCIKWFAELLFGSRYVLFGFAGIVLILFGIWLFQRIKGSAEARSRGDKNKEFSWVIFGVTAIYLLFSVLTASPAERYLAFAFPLVSILLWCWISFLAADDRIRKWAFCVCIALTIYGVLSQQVLHHDFHYIYSEDAEAIQTVEDSDVQDAILIFSDGFAGEHAVYDCVNLMPDSAWIYPVDKDHNDIDAANCPDRMLIWIYRGKDIDPYVEELTSETFQTQKIGRTHASDIYLAQRILGAEEEP